MNKTLRKLAVIAALVMPVSAVADLVIVDHTETPGGYTMTPFDTSGLEPGCEGTGMDQDPNTDGVQSLPGVTSVGSPIDGNVEFHAQGGNSPLCMSVDDPSNADWWEHDDHATVFTTTVNWIELIMPANTRAFSFFVGGMSGSGWIQAIDSTGVATPQVNFGSGSDIPFGSGNTPGFSVYSTDKCSSISKIIIEPWEWGTGHFAINQDECHEVPEPAPMLLLMTGLFGLALSRRITK